MKKSLISALLAPAILAMILAAPLLSAQDRKYPVRASDLSDEEWNTWRTGLETSEAADKAFQNQDYAAAETLYQNALEAFRKVRKSNPYWNRNGLIYRIAILKRKLAAARHKQSGHPVPAENNTETLPPDRRSAAAGADSATEIAALKTALADARNRCAGFQDELKRAALTAKQVESLLAEKAEMEKKYSMLLIQYNDIRNRLDAGKPSAALVTALENENKRTEAFRKSLELLRRDFIAIQTKLAQVSAEKNALGNTKIQLEKRLAESAGNEQLIKELRTKLTETQAAAAENAAKMRAGNKRLTDELAKKSRQADEAQEALTQLRASMDLNEAARRLEQEAAALRAENAALHRKTSDLNQRLAEQTGKAKLAANAESSAKTLAAQLSERNKQLASDLDMARKRCSEQTAAVRQTQEQLAVSQKEAGLLRAERNALAEKLSQASANTSTGMVAALTKANDENNKLKKDLDSARQETDALKKRVEKERASERAAWNAETGKLKAAAEDSQKKIQQLSAQAEQCKALSGENQKLRDSLAKLKTGKDALDNEMRELKKTLAYHERRAKEYDQIANNETLLKSTLLENKILKTEIAQVRAQKTDPAAKRELEFAKAGIKKAHAECERAMQEIKRLNAKAEEAKLHTAELEKQIETLNSENNVLKKDSAAQKQRAAASAAEAATKLKAAKAKLKEAGAKAQEAEQKLKEAGAKAQETETKAQPAHAAGSGVSLVEFEKLRAGNLRLHETIRKLNEDKARSGEELIALKQDLLSVKAHLEKARADIAADVRGKALETRLKQAEQQAGKWEADCKKTLEALAQTKHEKDSLAAKSAALEKQLGDASKKILRLENEVRKWSAGSEEVVKEKTAEKDCVIDQVMREHVALKKEINRLAAELSKAKAETAAAQKEASILRGKLNQAQAEAGKTAAAKKSGTSVMTTGNRVECNHCGGIIICSTSSPGGKTPPLAANSNTAEKPPAPVQNLTSAQKKIYADAMRDAEKFEKENDPDQAVWKYLIAADADPSAFQPHLALARIHRKAGKNTDALQEYKKAVALGAKHDPGMEELAATPPGQKN